MKRFNRKRRLALSALLALVVAASGYAFTATNTIASGGAAGDGSAAISGFTITNVAYQLSAANAANLQSVSFTVAPAAGSVQAKVVSTSTTYSTCVLTSGGTVATCTLPAGTTVTSADQLRVIATS
jgi:hypothetical protein